MILSKIVVLAALAFPWSQVHVDPSKIDHYGCSILGPQGEGTFWRTEVWWTLFGEGEKHSFIYSFRPTYIEGMKDCDVWMKEVEKRTKKEKK